MQILMINPNTSHSITELAVTAARRFASDGTIIHGATGRFGASYIASRAASAVAAHAALDAYAEHGMSADVIALSCFGDPGLGALKELARQPVVGMAEAACAEAAAGGRRFGIVTGGERWAAMLEEFVAAQGLSAQLASIQTVAPSGAEIARDPASALALLGEAVRTCVANHGAEVVILGGAGLAGLSARLQDGAPCALIDSVEAIVKAAEALGRLKPEKQMTGAFAPTPPVASIGLGTTLAALLAGHKATVD